MNIWAFTISTPTGKRVIRWFDQGPFFTHKGFAEVGKPFEAADAKDPTERLQFRSQLAAVMQQPDGVWIGAEHLLTISIGIAKRRREPVMLADICRDLFYDDFRPSNAAEAIAALPDGEFVKLVRSRFGFFRPDHAAIWPVLLQPSG